MKKIDHIGIAVKDMTTASFVYEKLMGAAPYKKEFVESEQVITAFFEVGESKVELLESQGAGSAISKFIAERGEGIHHIAFEVDDIKAEIKRLQAEGFQFVSDKPKPGADNKLICFLHPKNTNGVLIELCQELKS